MLIDYLSGIFVYFILWWIMLFTILPWGQKMDRVPKTGFARSAPITPRLILKFLVNSIITLIVWWVLGMFLRIYYPGFCYF